MGLIKKQIEIKASGEGEFYWVNPNNIKSLPMVNDLKEYIQILNKNPNAFIFGLFKYDESGKCINKTIKVM